jgi:hypothetical protein
MRDSITPRDMRPPATAPLAAGSGAPAALKARPVALRQVELPPGRRWDGNGPTSNWAATSPATTCGVKNLRGYPIAVPDLHAREGRVKLEPVALRPLNRLFGRVLARQGTGSVRPGENR